MTYTVTASGNTHRSFLAAVREADALKCNVVDTVTGASKWSPAPPVSSARMKRYREQLAAYNAQQRSK